MQRNEPSLEKRSTIKQTFVQMMLKRKNCTFIQSASSSCSQCCVFWPQCHNPLFRSESASNVHASFSGRFVKCDDSLSLALVCADLTSSCKLHVASPAFHDKCVALITYDDV